MNNQLKAYINAQMMEQQRPFEVKRRETRAKHLEYVQEFRRRYIHFPIEKLAEYREKCKPRYSIELALDFVTFREIYDSDDITELEANIIYEFMGVISDELGRRDTE